MNETKHLKAEELVRHLAAEFLQTESNRSSMITVTKVSLSPDESYAKVFITVFPEDKQKDAIEFAKRRAADFRDYIKKKARLRKIPLVEFLPDLGEAHRLQIDALSDNK